MSMSANLVDLFAQPLRTRLDDLSGDAKSIGAVRQELEIAALSFGAYTDQQSSQATKLTGQWKGKAAQGFQRRAGEVGTHLRDTATALATGSAVVDNAAGSVHTGRTMIQALLDEYVGKANQTLGAALKLVDAGQHGALIGAAGELSSLADSYVAQAETVYQAVRQTLTTAAQRLDALDDTVANASAQPANGGTTASSAQPAHHATKPRHPSTSGTKAARPTGGAPVGGAHHPGAHKPATHPSSARTVDLGHGLGTVTAPNAKAATAVRAALTQLGVPYAYGGETPGQAFDCSGLTAWAYSKAGVNLVHYASSQRVGRKIGSAGQLEPGDLVVFSGHVTMYIGQGHVIAAPYTGTDVQIQPLFTAIQGDPFLGFYRPSA